MKIVVGAILLSIAVQLCVPAADDEENDNRHGYMFASAGYIIMLVNLTMSLDNALGVAAAAAGDSLILILGLVISVLIIGVGSNAVLDVMTRFPVIYPLSAALVGYLAGTILVGDLVIKDWIHVHLSWLQTVSIGRLDFSVSGLIGAGGVFFIARLFRSLTRTHGNGGTTDAGNAPPVRLVADYIGVIRNRLAGYRILALLPYAIVIAVVYLGHPLYVYHKNWLLKQVRYYGLNLGMTVDEVMQIKGLPVHVVEDLPNDAKQILIAVERIPKGKTIQDYPEWEFHTGNSELASLEIVYSRKTSQVTQIGCYSEKGYCLPVSGISTGASADEVIEKLGRPRNVQSNKDSETFDYPELHLSIVLVDKRVVMLKIHNFENVALQQDSGR